MNKWIAEFDLEDGDTMPECMDLEYKGAKLDFHCRPMWIPVSERLPEDRELVLCSSKRGGVFEGRYFDDETDFQWYAFRNDEFVRNDVIDAWMPLLEPYKAESEEEE